MDISFCRNPINATVTITDSANPAVSRTCTFTITGTEPVRPVACSTPEIVGNTGASITGYSATASDGVPPYTYRLGVFFTGLTINENTGELSGTYPATPDSGNYRVRVTDSIGSTSSCTSTYRFTTPVTALSFSCEAISAGWNEAVESDITITGGTAPFTLTTSTGGFRIEPTSSLRTFKLKGTSQSADGTQSVIVEGYDSGVPAQNATCTTAITVSLEDVTCSDFTDTGYRNEQNSSVLSVAGGTGSYTYTAGAGSSLITVDSNGIVIFSGSATDGTFTRTITVTDSADSTNSDTCTATFIVRNARPLLFVTGYRGSEFGTTLSGRAIALEGSGGWTYAANNATIESLTGNWRATIPVEGTIVPEFQATSSTSERINTHIRLPAVSDAPFIPPTKIPVQGDFYAGERGSGRDIIIPYAVNYRLERTSAYWIRNIPGLPEAIGPRVTQATRYLFPKIQNISDIGKTFIYGVYNTSTSRVALSYRYYELVPGFFIHSAARQYIEDDADGNVIEGGFLFTVARNTRHRILTAPQTGSTTHVTVTINGITCGKEIRLKTEL